MSCKAVIIAVPFVPGKGNSQKEQFEEITRRLGVVDNCMGTCFGVPPDLKVGTLDSLMECSDDLFKVDPQIEAITFKFLHFLEDIHEHEMSKADLAEIILPNNSAMRVEEYLSKFNWNDAQYPKKTDLKKLIDGIRDGILRAEDVCRTKLNEYGELKTRMAAVEKKAGGNLAVKPISGIVQAWYKEHREDGPVETDHLTTTFIVIPADRKKEFESQYVEYGKAEWEDAKSGRTVSVCVAVPESAMIVEQSKEFILYSVVLLKKFADNFKNTCREKRLIIREFGAEDDMTVEAVQDLKRQKEQKKEQLQRWLKSTFSNAYVSWIHLKAVRIFVESILRYGLPPNFVAIMFHVSGKAEKQLRAKMLQTFSSLGRAIGSDSEIGGDTNALEQEHPYVSLKVSHPANK